MTVNGTYSVIDTHPCYVSDNTRYVFTSNPSIICVLLYIFLGLLSFATVCGNLLVIISVIYFKQLHTPTNYLILSLAVADLFVGVLVCPFSMAFTVTFCRYNAALFCKVRGSIDVTLSTTSILNLCCISIDRYYAICQPLIYKTKINDRVSGIMILLSWAIAAVVGISVMVASFYRGKCGKGCLIDAVLETVMSCVFCFYIPVIVMLTIYLKIFIVARKQAFSIHNTTCQSTKSGAVVSKMERKATKTLAIVMGAFLLCWTPFFFSLTFLSFIRGSVPLSAIETLNWITLSNSMLNPFIYAFFYSWFRAAFKMIISGKIFQGDISNSKLL
ncbi:trace amine-associated receptor 1-like [Centropristis striata]|uniref:trace amine-associated receptor 1-like n=1 Tax=Centropristis striata TaxID=184440 RepID=UPI0027E05A94|nr:trace amine-associated receptor 1-like [Centropristis striata]